MSIDWNTIIKSTNGPLTVTHNALKLFDTWFARQQLVEYECCEMCGDHFTNAEIVLRKAFLSGLYANDLALNPAATQKKAEY